MPIVKRIKFLIRISVPAGGYIRLEDLADMLSAVADGGIILSKVTRGAEALPRQLLLYRDFVKLVFTPPAQ